jgi:hypothetical protein
MATPAMMEIWTNSDRNEIHHDLFVQGSDEVGAGHRGRSGGLHHAHHDDQLPKHPDHHPSGIDLERGGVLLAWPRDDRDRAAWADYWLAREADTDAEKGEGARDDRCT